MIKDNLKQLLNKRREELKLRKELKDLYERLLYRSEDNIVACGFYSYLIKKVEEDIKDDELEIQFYLYELGCQ